MRSPLISTRQMQPLFSVGQYSPLSAGVVRVCRVFALCDVRGVSV